MADALDKQPLAIFESSYWQRAKTPLASLVFMLPLILFYEISVSLLGIQKVQRMLEMDRPISDIKARMMLFDLFQWLGISAYYLPGLVVIAVLFFWHVARRDPWKIELQLYLFMWLEAIAMALPLFVLGWMMSRHLPMAAPLVVNEEGGVASIVLSIGAGIYEELLFRLMILTLLHMLFIDLLKLAAGAGMTLAVAISAIAFALYHFSWDQISGQLLGIGPQPASAAMWNLIFFYTVAGVYFSSVFLLRGFGIVAWTHALYDVFVFVLYRQHRHDG